MRLSAPGSTNTIPSFKCDPVKVRTNWNDVTNWKKRYAKATCQSGRPSASVGTTISIPACTSFHASTSTKRHQGWRMPATFPMRSAKSILKSLTKTQWKVNTRYANGA